MSACEWNGKSFRLDSPAGAEPVIYKFPLLEKGPYSERRDIADTVEFALDNLMETDYFCGKLKKEEILPAVWLKNREHKPTDAEIKNISEKFNGLVKHFLQKMSEKNMAPVPRRAKECELDPIMGKLYALSVDDPRQLNRRGPPSSGYGEMHFSTVSEIVKEVLKARITLDGPNVTIADLGAGIGNVVMHMAATRNVEKVWGFEIANIAFDSSKKMEMLFRRWMQWCGFKFSPFELIKGSFLDEQHTPKILGATLIFANNLVFSADTNHCLKTIFGMLRHSAVIVSSESLVCGRRSGAVTRHNTEDFPALVNMEVQNVPGQVSWTWKPTPFFLHFVNKSPEAVGDDQNPGANGQGVVVGEEGAVADSQNVQKAAAGKNEKRRGKKRGAGC